MSRAPYLPVLFFNILFGLAFAAYLLLPEWKPGTLSALAGAWVLLFWSSMKIGKPGIQAAAKTEKPEDELAPDLEDAPTRTIQVPDFSDPRIQDWLARIEPEIMAKSPKDPSGNGEPYYGACGGGLTYEVTHTSLGTVVVVREAFTGKGLNLTDYSSW